MNEAEADRIAAGSFHNREQVMQSAACGCFHCLASFPGSEVHEWLDGGQTAVCPRCGIDSVLANVTDEMILRSLHHHRFETVYRFDAAGNPVRA